MIVSFRKLSLSFFIVYLLTAFVPAPASAQSPVLQKRITITAVNQPLSDVLSKIARQLSVKFSYNPVELSARKPVTIRATNEPLSAVLSRLINNPEFRFREMGNQVIIYKPANTAINVEKTETNKETAIAPPTTETPVTKPAESHPQVKPDTLKKPALARADTVFVKATDTVVRIDTLIVRDTIHRFDTVFIEKALPVYEKPGSALPGTANQAAKRNPWSVEPSYIRYFGKATLVNEEAGYDELKVKLGEAESSSNQNFSSGLMLMFKTGKLNLGSGIYYTRLGETFDYEYLEQTGGYYLRDTVETYYTVTGIDTSWFYITDSTWLNLDYKRYSTMHSNVYSFIDIPLIVRLAVVDNDKFTLFAGGGFIAGIFTGSSAMTIHPADLKAEKVSNEMINPFVLSWTASLGTSICLNKNIWFTAEASYRSQFTSLYEDYPVEKKFQLPGIRAGLCIKL